MTNEDREAALRLIRNRPMDYQLIGSLVEAYPDLAAELEPAERLHRRDEVALRLLDAIETPDNAGRVSVLRHTILAMERDRREWVQSFLDARERIEGLRRELDERNASEEVSA